MNYSRVYLDQVELLLQVLPVINEQDCFALKGGTALNLFIRDMPRLSVDIDLTYLPIEPRSEFLNNINAALITLAMNIKRQVSQCKIKEMYTKEPRQISKLLVFNDNAKIIIEPNLVLRGAVFDCETHGLSQRAQDEFLKFFKIKTLSFADLYGGKMSAALARQHPRDLFDIKLLLENEGLTDQIRKAFVVYLASNTKPMHEMLNPNLNTDNLHKIFTESFMGMTRLEVDFEELIEVRGKLLYLILKSITVNEKRFLLSIKEGNPNWEFLQIPGINKLPALEWKRLNILKMDKTKQKNYLNKLRDILEI